MRSTFGMPEPRVEPNEPKALGVCKCCNEYICEYDDIVIFDGGVYHSDCFADKAPEILLRDYGAIACVAKRGEVYG